MSFFNKTKPSPSANASSSEPSPLDWTCVGRVSTYISSNRTTIKLHARRITIIHVPTLTPPFTAIDTICYHAGGPLAEGPIRSVGGRTCLQCPWHSYLVDIETGEGLYMDLNRSYQSKGKRQRIHQVEIRNNHLWVKLSAAQPSEGVEELPSDGYAYRPRFPGRPGGGEENVPQFPDW